MTVSDDLAAEMKAHLDAATYGSEASIAASNKDAVADWHAHSRGYVRSLLSDRSSRIARAEAMAKALEIATKRICSGCFDNLPIVREGNCDVHTYKGVFVCSCGAMPERTALAAYRSGT